MVVETKRLVLRNFEETDIKDFYEMVSQEDVGPRCGWEPYTSEEYATWYENIENCDLVMTYMDKDMYSKKKTGREIEISH